MRNLLPTLWKIGKIVLPILILIGVGRHFYDILSDPKLWNQPLTLRPIPLILAGLLYLIAHTLWATFWVQLLHNQGAKVPWTVGIRAYFVSQLGKYVPGKAWVIVLRVAMLRHLAPSKSMLVLTGLYETLTSMAAGAVVAALLVPWLAGVSEHLSGRQWMLLPLAAMPLGMRLVHRIARRVGQKYNQGTMMPLLPFKLMLRGMLQATVGWVCLGLSLWLTMIALQPDYPDFTRDGLMRSVGINAIAYVLGFAVLFAPGGIGVREYIFQQLLAVEFATYWITGEPAGLAVVVTLVLRLVWTVSELIAMGLLAWLVRVPMVDSALTANRSESPEIVS